MKKLLGKDLVLTTEVEGRTVAIAGNTSCSLELNGNTLDATTKDDNDEWESQLPASKSWSVGWEGLVCESTTQTAELIIGLMIASQPISGTFRIGSVKYKGTGIITATSYTGQVKDLAKASFTLTGQGALSKVTGATSSEA